MNANRAPTCASAPIARTVPVPGYIPLPQLGEASAQSTAFLRQKRRHAACTVNGTNVHLGFRLLPIPQDGSSAGPREAVRRSGVVDPDTRRDKSPGGSLARRRGGLLV